jgi:hypothetical protein
MYVCVRLPVCTLCESVNRRVRDFIRSGHWFVETENTPVCHVDIALFVRLFARLRRFET